MLGTTLKHCRPGNLSLRNRQRDFQYRQDARIIARSGSINITRRQLVDDRATTQVLSIRYIIFERWRMRP